MGETLVKTVVKATGLPQEPVQKELEALLEQCGKTQDDLTLDDLRDVMVEYLQSVFLDLEKNRKNAS